jgi:hypothetical protein
VTYIRPPIWPTRCLISGDLSHCIKYMTSCVELRVCLPMVSLFATGRPSSPKCSACSARPANLKCSDCFGANMFCFSSDTLHTAGRTRTLLQPLEKLCPSLCHPPTPYTPLGGPQHIPTLWEISIHSSDLLWHLTHHWADHNTSHTLGNFH